jgi:hypothetical protein
MTPADLLIVTGRALFGERWKADMAQALNARAELTGGPRVSVDRVDDWSKGRGNGPPQGVWLELAGLIQDRERDLPAIKAAILEAANAKG